MGMGSQCCIWECYLGLAQCLSCKENERLQVQKKTCPKTFETQGACDAAKDAGSDFASWGGGADDSWGQVPEDPPLWDESEERILIPPSQKDLVQWDDEQEDLDGELCGSS